MANFKMVIQYDGTSYKGWQSQNSTKDTIQGKLQNILEKLSGQQINVIGSGRTDAGVHAVGQVANFHMDRPANMSDREILQYINMYLPEDIAVISLEEVGERFHARYSETGKTYRYRIHVSKISNVFEKRYVYRYLDYPLDVEAMRSAAGYMIGEHDFKAFCSNKNMKKSTVRNVKSIEIEEITDENGRREITLDFTGDGFLQNMIRIMVGTLIEVGSGRRTPESIEETLVSLDRQRAGYTAPPQGLCLMQVYYEKG